MKRKIIVAVIIFIVITLIIISSWLVYKKYIKDAPIEDELPPPPPDNNSGGGTPPPNNTVMSFPLKKGMDNSSVIDVQNALNKKCKANLVADGKFGPKTESALKSCYGVTQVNEALYTQMKSDVTGGCPEGKYKVPGIGCISIFPTTPTQNPATTLGGAAAIGLKKGENVVSRMPTMVLFSAPVGNSSIGKISNLDSNKIIGVFESIASSEFSKLWLNVSYVKNNGMIGSPPAWVYVYTSLIKKK